MGNRTKYAIEASKGKYVKSFDGNGVLLSGLESCRMFRTKMEAEIFLNVHGGIDSLKSLLENKTDGLPAIVEA